MLVQCLFFVYGTPRIDLTQLGHGQIAIIEDAKKRSFSNRNT